MMLVRSVWAKLVCFVYGISSYSEKISKGFSQPPCRLTFVFLNSFYSFYWDVAKDWDLTLFSSSQERNNPEHPWGLRRHTHFHTKEMYYGAIVIDLMLRCTWSFKLSPHLDHFNDLEGGIFAMEFLEVFRRFIWIFFRVETEWGKQNNYSTKINRCHLANLVNSTVKSWTAAGRDSSC